MNKKMASYYERWQESNMDTLWKAYAKPSKKKWDAWEYCKETCRVLNGKDLKIIGANTYVFSAGFIFEKNGVQKFCYIGPSGNNTAEVK